VEEPGVLILSRLAGAAETMREALQVNPYNTDAVAECLHQALGMDLAERTARMRALQQRERRHDVHAWLDAVLRAAAEARIRPVGPGRGAWLGEARRWPLALFSTTTGRSHRSSAAGPGAPRRGMSAALAACGARGHQVAVVSGRALDVRSRIDVPASFAGNHGLEIEGPASLSRIRPPHSRALAGAGACAS
jgi:hypothetical protein